MDSVRAQLVALLVNSAQTADGIRTESGSREVKEAAGEVALKLLQQAEALIGKKA